MGTATITLKQLLLMGDLAPNVIGGIRRALQDLGVSESNRPIFVTALGLVAGDVEDLPEPWKASLFGTLEGQLDSMVRELGADGAELEIGHLFLRNVRITTGQGATINLPFMMLDLSQVIGLSFGSSEE